MPLWNQVYKCIFETLLSGVGGIFPERELLHHVRNHMFSTAAVPFYIPTNSAQGSSFSTSLPTLVIFCWLYFSIAKLTNGYELGFVLIFFFNFIFRFYLFIFRDRKGGRKRGRKALMCERYIDWLPLKPPTKDLPHNPGMCPDWELNWWLFGLQVQVGTQPTEPHQPGQVLTFLTLNIIWNLFCYKD